MVEGELETLRGNQNPSKQIRKLRALSILVGIEI